MSPRTPNDEAEDRLERWVSLYAQALFGFLVIQVRNKHLAEDLLQETFCRAWEARNRYAESGAERGYLWRIADRLVRDWWRKSRRETSLANERGEEIDIADDAQPQPSQIVAGIESREQLESAMQTLSEPQRRTLLLRYYGQLEFHEIGTLLEMPLNTVLSHARRGLAALRRSLVESSNDG
jgi:RNA polymerase sigma-70 factor (ECF subfamily)